jgi:hypothetical protein
VTSSTRRTVRWSLRAALSESRSDLIAGYLLARNKASAEQTFTMPASVDWSRRSDFRLEVGKSPFDLDELALQVVLGVRYVGVVDYAAAPIMAGDLPPEVR